MKGGKRMASPKNPNQPSQSTFLPTEYVRGKTQTRANVLALILFGAVIIGVVGAFFLNNTRLQSVMNRESDVDEQTRSAAEHLEQLKALRVQREGMIESAELVTALIESVPRSVLLAELVRDMPDELVLTDIDLTGTRVKAPVAPKANVAAKPKRPTARSISNRVSVGKDQGGAGGETKVLPPRFKHRVVLTGLAAVNNDVADYLARLKDSPLFGAVELQYIAETTVEDVELRKFQISMNLLSNADVSLVEAAVETTLIENDAFGDLAPELSPPPIDSFGLAPTGEDGN